MSVDWSQFRDGDKVRVVFEGTWEEDAIRLALGHMAVSGTLRFATSAELIERPFTPPSAGEFFRIREPGAMVWISLGPDGFHLVRGEDGHARFGATRTWSGTSKAFRDSIEVLDI